jgi:RHS repeat-associated protein
MRVRKVRTSQARTVTHLGEVRYLPGLEIRSNTATGKELHVVTVTAGHSNVRVLHWQSAPPANVANDQIRYSLTDHLGSSTLELDADAQLISQEIYYPYGETAWFAGRSEVEAKYKTVRYSGKERDATGLYYYGLRYYAPWLMRWINPDPAGGVDGPNYYRFVRNDPINFNDPSGAKPSKKPLEEAIAAYDLMFEEGAVWAGLKRSDKNGLDTMRRISEENLSSLSLKLETEKQQRVASRIAQISPVDSWITHFSNKDFETWRSVKVRSLVGVREHGKNKNETGNSGKEIDRFATHDFAFFAWEAGGAQPHKQNSDFGRYRYHASMAVLGDKFEYSHVEMADLQKPNKRQLSLERARDLGWLRGDDATLDGIDRFLQRDGLDETAPKDLLFLGADMIRGMGMRVAADLNSLTPETQDAVVEWSEGHRATENLGQIITSFYRPQIAVPGGVKIKKGDYELRWY